MTEEIRFDSFDPQLRSAVIDILRAHMAAMPDGARVISGSLSHLDYSPTSAQRWKLNADGSYDISLLSDITASADELNVLDGYTGSVAELNEMDSFFSATDITGAEAEELTGGGETVLHTHASGFRTTLVAGKAFDGGSVVSVESDSKAWPCRFTSYGSSSLASIFSAAATNGWAGVADLSDTLKLVLVKNNTVITVNYLSLITVDPATNTITAIDNTSLTLTAGATHGYSLDIRKLDSTRAVVAFMETVGGATYVRTKVINCSGGTITQGAILSVKQTSALGVAVSVDSATEYFVWYQDNANGIRASQVTVTAPTTLTLGTENAVTGTTTSDTVKGACQFGSSSHHVLTFYDHSATDTVLICGSNSAGTLTFGAGVSAGLYAGSSTDWHNMQWMDDDRLAAVNGHVNITRNAYVRVAVRSGTTLTVTPYGGYIAGMGSIANFPGLVSFGNGELAVSCCTTVYKIISISVDGATCTAGTAVTVGGAIYGFGMVASFTPSSVIGLSVNDTSWSGTWFSISASGNMNQFIGTMENDVASGATATIDTGGLVDYMAGLTAGQRYAVQPGGGVNYVRTYGGRYCGVSKSATEMLIQT